MAHDLKIEEKRIADEAKLTPQAIAARELKNKIAADKRKATKEGNKRLSEALVNITTSNAFVSSSSDYQNPVSISSSSSEPSDQPPIAFMNIANSNSETDSDFEEIVNIHFKNNKNHERQTSKTISMKSARLIRKNNMNKLKTSFSMSERKAESVEREKTQLDSSLSNLNILSDAYNKMVLCKFEKLNVNVDTTIPLNSIVIVKVILFSLKLGLSHFLITICIYIFNITGGIKSG